MRAALQLFPLLLLLLFAASCSSVRAEPADPGKTPPPETTVEVRNLKKVDFNLYVLRGASRIRLGIVPGMTTRNFVIPAHLVGDFTHIRFALEMIGTFGKDGIGSQRRTTSEEELPVRAGEQLSLTIHEG